MPSQPSNLLTDLQTATQGLQWVSESDHPFAVFYWQNQSDLTLEQILQQTHHAADTPVETVDPDTFFAVATQAQNWHSDEDRAIVQRYQTLVATLKQHLTDLRVYRIGEINIDIYIVGKTEAGDLAGVSTQAVET